MNIYDSQYQFWKLFFQHQQQQLHQLISTSQLSSRSWCFMASIYFDHFLYYHISHKKFMDPFFSWESKQHMVVCWSLCSDVLNQCYGGLTLHAFCCIYIHVSLVVYILNLLHICIYHIISFQCCLKQTTHRHNLCY